MIIDLPPQTAQIITTIAHEQGQSVEHFIIMSAYEKALQLAFTSDVEVWQPSDNDMAKMNDLLNNPM